ncbi:triple tyrosine motif-containing protein [Adhaeribacter rhizoryzae]|uniref:Transcriptional regulator n=1 Tax=Adhaeribacter rhizoryzae TaxID=2607907 RepID=A0A5M6D6Y1_9BACT|nr:triple tyrosine motif-containing protein [Adhaeribacter rhizoryzae]KAA5543304.1 transcriptional regulator [Adhaeribacter rhizoryzae]
MSNIFKFFLFLLFFTQLTATGGPVLDMQNIGVPYVQNYSKRNYLAGNKNWSVVKDKTGVMYFGNSDGLLTFDGKFWNLYRLPNRQIVRSVATDNQGSIYTGGFSEFGFWAYNQAGKFTYHSLIKLLPRHLRPSDEIWKIYVDGDRVLFQSFGGIYIYENGKIKVVQGQQPFLFLFKANNRFFAEVIGEGLYELKNDSLHFIAASKILGNSGVLSVLPFQKDKYLIGTAKNGLFLYDGQQITPWQNQADNFLKTYQLNNGALVLGKYFAFGTILNGVIILDEAGGIVQRLNKSSGLQNNTVLNLYTDNEQNLWAALDNGIDRIEVNSPLYFYFDQTGKFGTVYTSLVHDNKIYLGTNQGLFYSNWPANNERFFHAFDFTLVPGSQGQVWHLSVQDGQLLCGHNEGTYRVQGNQLTKISDVKGGWVIKKLNANPNLLIQGTYTGLVIYKKDAAGNWVFSHKIPGFNQPSLYVEQDKEGNIWVSHAYKGVYRLNLNANLTKLAHSTLYGKAQGLPNNYNVNIFNLEGNILFSSDAGFYVHDEISDRFAPYTQLNKKLGAFASSNKIIKAGDKKYWFINHGKVALVNLLEPGKLKIKTSPFDVLNDRMVQYYENISQINKHIYLISVDDGFVFYNTHTRLHNQNSLPKVLIRKVENITENTALITEVGSTPVQIPYAQNNIRIAYALPYYNQAKVKYSYLLEGNAARWSDWHTETAKEFTNLRYGKYRFLVKARVNDEAESKITVFTFTILPPWYATGWAYFLYVVLLIGLVFLLRHLYRRKLLRDQQHIQAKLEKEKEEFLQQEILINEQRIVKLKNEQLQAELASKSRELANSALNIVYKNELLQNIQEEIVQLKDTAGKKIAADQLRKIQRVIDEGKTDERDWNLLEHSFNEAHENYFKKLRLGHPELTPNDLKLCAYLRMNMSSKEIASLLNITVRGVEIRRYRLRKKLNLDHDKNLVEFLLEL